MKSLNKKQNKISKLAIFSGSLLVAASAILLFAPVIKSNAAEKTLNVTAIIDPVISLSLDKSALDFNIIPTSTGVFDSGSIIATVDTNSTGGYELYFSSEDSSTAMTSLVSESTIASDFSSTVTSSTMAANKWGYSLDATNFSTVPTLANQAKIKDISLTPTAAEKVTTITIGTKIDSSLPSGAYSKKVVITAVAHPSRTPTLSDLTTMQQMTHAICSASAVHETNTLTDPRDGSTYTVAKLAGGDCWMTQNLRIAGVTLHPSDSDVAVDFELPASVASTSAFQTTDESIALYIDETNPTTYGGYYTFPAAAVGSVAPVINYGETSYSICPKGWKLPSMSNVNTLNEQYYNAATYGLDKYEPNHVLGGTLASNGVGFSLKNMYAYYWTSYVNSKYPSFYGLQNNSYVSGVGSKGQNGYSVRCVAR